MLALPLGLGVQPRSYRARMITAHDAACPAVKGRTDFSELLFQQCGHYRAFHWAAPGFSCYLLELTG